VIYEGLKGILLTLLKAPAGPPESPSGSPGSVQVFRASRQFLIYKLVVVGMVFALFTLIPGVITLATLFSPDVPTAARLLMVAITSGAILLGLFAFFTTRLEYDVRYYLITDRSLRIREGVWTINEITLTYANIQHMEIKQGPIQQMLGISDLVVRTAGGSAPLQAEQAGQMLGHRGVLRGIENAEEIRDLINGYLKQYRHAGLGDPEERRAARKVGTLHPAALGLLREIRDDLLAWRLSR
jgi:uncharacterized membrane protein YdbT with pleckstrin-like domain